jgi:hypothetical protein
VKLSKVIDCGGFTSKRRDCTQCNYADTALIREEIVKVIEVSKRVRQKVRRRTLTANEMAPGAVQKGVR